jgi:hypothetical protein
MLGEHRGKTAQGRVRAARNAYRHGLLAALCQLIHPRKWKCSQTKSPEQALTPKLPVSLQHCGSGKSVCVRHVRHQLLSDNYNDSSQHERKAAIRKLPRSELSQLSMDALFEYAMTPTSEQPKNCRQSSRKEPNNYRS